MTCRGGGVKPPHASESARADAPDAGAASSVPEAGPGRAKRFPLRLEDAVASRRRPLSTAGQEVLRPQRPLSDAARDARQSSSPAGGMGLDSDIFRRRMVERLRQEAGADEVVLQAMAAVARHQFVDPALAGQAYEDTSLPIGLGQTISKPSVVARMVSLLRARAGGAELQRVLEIGTGCGYQAAVLTLLARQVYSVERLKALYERARENLSLQRPANLRLVYGDGRLGHGPNAPYDGIIAAAGGEALPPAWLDQLAIGGRLVAPLADPARGGQVLVVVDKLADGSLVQTRHEMVRFVPLESGISDYGHC
jgi:protein-L-isoaspartate(D-aspartate) O-methyltransferase